MQKIHFYKKNKIVYSVWANSVEEVELDPSSYYPNYTNDMFISLVEYVNPVIDSKGDLREKTRDELVAEGILIPLEIGEKIVDKKIIKVPKPDNKNYWNWDGQKWVYDNDKEKTEYFNRIDEIKAKSLAYGFDYKVEGKEHRQRCRDKDISAMAASLIELIAEKLIGNDKAVSFWYFEDNYEWEVNLMTLTTLARYGKTFATSVYKTEHYFKTKIGAKNITEEEFETKRKEFHDKLAKIFSI